MTEATQRTSDNGVSIWLDDLSRSRIESGSLQDLIANKNVVGVTTNQFGLQGDGAQNMIDLGITAEHVVEAAKASIAEVEAAK